MDRIKLSSFEGLTVLYRFIAIKPDGVQVRNHGLYE